MTARALRLALCPLLLLAALPAPAAAPRAPAGAASPPTSAGAASAHALRRAPASPSAEVGADDFRISYMGGDTQFDAASPAVAYNSQENEYLVVWWGEDDAPPLVANENEIFAQRVNAATGAPIVGPVRLSHMGPDGDTAFGAFNPAVAYNSQANNYLVVWHGDHSLDGKIEVFGRLVDARGAPLGPGQFQISDMGASGDTAYVGADPAVVYNVQANQYLVVWQGDDFAGPLVNNEFEIFAQRIAADGAPVLPNDVRLSHMGPDGDTSYEAENPAVAYNSQANEYFVVWDGDHNAGGLVNGEYEIFGRRVGADGLPIGASESLLSTVGNAAFDAQNPALAYNGQADQYLVAWEGDTDTVDELEIFGRLVAGATGAALGAEIRLSRMGPDGSPAYNALSAAVAYHPAANEYFVAWEGDHNLGGQVDNEVEIFGRRLDALGAPLGAGAARLSDLGPDADPAYDAADPALAVNPAAGEYLLAWHGDDFGGGQLDGENEIFVQRLAGAGQELGPNDLRLSFAGPESFPDYTAADADVAFNPARGEYLVVWSGDHNTGSMVDEEFEIFGQRLEAATGAPLGPPLRLSDMGPDGDPDFWAIEPAVVFNPAANEYLVVWRGDDDTPPLVKDEEEIFAQRVNAATGAEIGGDFRISDMGPDGDTSYHAMSPGVAYNSLAPAGGEYLVVWDGSESAPPLPAAGDRIFGQRLSSAGSEVGANDFVISEPGGAFVQSPAVAFNSLENEYLVAWELWGADPQVYSQRVDGATGNPVGGDVRLSDIDLAAQPAVAFNNLANEYLVVWHGTDSTPPLVAGEIEVFAQRVSGLTGLEAGDDLRLSRMGPDGNTTDYIGAMPAVSFDPLAGEYLVVWAGADDTPPLVGLELEIFGQRLAGATAAEVGPDDFRLSDMGPPGNATYDAAYPDLVYNSVAGEYLVVWQADDDTSPLVDEDFEIFGQRFVSTHRQYLPLVAR